MLIDENHEEQEINDNERYLIRESHIIRDNRGADKDRACENIHESVSHEWNKKRSRLYPQGSEGQAVSRKDEQPHHRGNRKKVQKAK